jgi:hypothetical protein
LLAIKLFIKFKFTWLKTQFVLFGLFG